MEIKKDNPEEPGSENLLGSKSKYNGYRSRFEEIINSEPRKKRKNFIPEFEDSLFDNKLD